MKSLTYKAIQGNRSPQNIVIVDSRVQGFMYMLSNGVFVPPFNPSVDNVTFMPMLSNYLRELSEEDDVREAIEVDFKVQERFAANHKNPAMEKIKMMREMEKRNN